MDYVVLNVPCRDEQESEILTAELADFPFDSFETEAGLLKAYIPGERLADCKAEVDAMLGSRGLEGRYVAIETQNWNALWERNFPPVEVEGRLLIRAPFHAPAPRGVAEVVIMPRMSFGTGHHATTWLMASATLDLGVAGRCGLDMGCGTGVLAILALLCGAGRMTAIDIDGWAVENSRENAAANGVGERVEALLGDAQLLAGRHFDFILANINRNILLADMPAYAATLSAGGDLVLSGFLAEDVPALTARGEELGLSLVGRRERDGWLLLHLRRDRA